MTRLARSLSALTVAGMVVAGTSVCADNLEHGPPLSADRPTSSSVACSSFALDNGGVTVFGANLDHVTVHAGLVFVNQRGVVKSGLDTTATGERAHWVSRYASLTFNLVGFGIAWAGMNERGLVMSTMSLDPTVQPAPDARPPLDTGEWMQYLLDTCATIEEVLATDPLVRITTPDHYLVADAYGNAAAVEFLNGRMVVHTGAAMPVQVLTNSTYDSSVQTWLAYKQAHSSDYSRLDGSLHRFCLAADRAAAFEPCDDAAAVTYAFDTLQRIAGEQFSIHKSQWSIVFDTANARAYYRTYWHPEIRFVDLASFDPWCTGPVQMLDIQAAATGDVADLFSDYSHDTNLNHMRRFLIDWGVPFTERGLLWMVQHLEHFPCQRFRPPRRVLPRGP
jgi:penicillin V acylase-like amidase (Ntn superfamily)